MNNLKNIIRDTFFYKVVNDALSGSISVYGYTYNIGFNTIITKPDGTIETHKNYYLDLQTLYINHYEHFCTALYELGEEICNNQSLWVNPENNAIIEEKLHNTLALIWANATYEDFVNPISFIKRYTNFLKDTTFKSFETPQNIGEVNHLDNYSIIVEKQEALNTLETPYYLNIKLQKNSENGIKTYVLPRIMYGIDTNDSGKKIGYIYAIQGTKDPQDDPYFKKLTRSFYKVNSKVKESESTEYLEFISNESDYYPENISDVSPSALISLTIVIGLFKKYGIEIIKVPDLLPMRWYAKRQALLKTVRFKTKREPNFNIKEYAELAIKEQQRIQQNITERFIRTFRRLDFHFENVDIDTLPTDSSFMQLKNTTKYRCNNPLLNELYNKTISYEENIFKK